MEILVILLLILANGLLSMSEIAVVSLRKSKIQAEAKEGSSSAKQVAKLCADPDRFFSTVQIGITFIGILTGIYSGDALSEDFAHCLKKTGVPVEYSIVLAQTIIVILATYLTLVFGELVPKRIGFSSPEKISKIVASPMLLLSKIAHPFVWILSKSTSVIATILCIKKRSEHVTEEEIKQMIAEGAKTGEVQTIEKNIVDRAFTLGDRRITSIMTPRPDIVGIETNMSKSEILKVLETSPHIIYPVYKKTLDDIVGVVSVKDLICDISSTEFNLNKHLRNVCFINEFVKVYDTLETLRKKKIKYAIINGEFGITMGIVTMNDVLDALVGDMPEIDEEPDIIERKDGSLLVNGQCSFYDFIMKVNATNTKDTSYNTVGGMILAQIGKIPNVGDKVQWDNFVFEVVDMDSIRIDKVLISKKQEENE